MSSDEFHLKRQSAIYAVAATFLLLLSRSLTNDYELTQAFVAVNHVLVFIIIILYLKSLSLISRLYKRPLKKDPLRIYVWFCFGMNILMTVIQFVAQKALLDSKALSFVTIVTSLPVSIGVYCLYVRNASNNSKLKLHCIIGFAISMTYLFFRLMYSVLFYSGVPESNAAMIIFSKSGSISLILCIYVFVMGIAYYTIARERDNNLFNKQKKEKRNNEENN